MKLKWLSFKYHNIQSYTDTTIKLNKEGLTVLEADNETGKSVFVKCIKFGINYNRFPKDKRKTIVRNWEKWESKKDDGIFGIELEENYAVFFIFSLESMKTIVKYPDDRKRVINGPADEEVCQLLGLMKIKMSERISNILDNEDKIIFDDTDATGNEDFLSAYITHQSLEDRKRNAEILLEEVKNSNKIKEKQLKSDLELFQTIPRVNNLDLIDLLINRMESKNEKINRFEEVLPNLIGLNSLKLKISISTNEIEKRLERMHKVSVIVELVEELSKIKEPIYLESNPEQSLKGYLEFMKSIRDLTASLNKIYRVPDKKKIVNTNKLKNKFKVSYVLKRYLKILLLIESIKREHKKTINIIELKKITSTYNRVQLTRKILNSIFQINELQENKKQVNKIEIEIIKKRIIELERCIALS